ncbi:ATP-binding protein [Tamlana sp. 2_MG-2023]|uniref:hybrid sensor histidine kinase/response regulator n=1 Tax=unclassified Tamlana TaxID=2614803 RepID=UPI0026E432EB|nr:MULTISPECIES: ATP-binding protein [unclassified Tamlana]MDO6759683.1 ATP-binding protein [Tamlana sp. 2_MG-2023]MDO6791306.1 ATP-binding protein [Tamlana sp. 1_MG-2023]
MEQSKHRITFKVLIGYIILVILATISGFLVLSEIRTFTQLQKQDISDRNKIVKTGGLIADIYKNESLARAAIQLNSTEKFNEYLIENEKLISKIDSLNVIVSNSSQASILDSIKLVIDKKLKNIKDLKSLKTKDNSDTSFNKAINKLSSIDSLLGKVTIGDLVKNPNTLDAKNRKKFEEYVSILNRYNPKDSINNVEQKQVDSLLSISRDMLKDAQIKTSNQRISLLNKERELIDNDLIISRKLQELLSNLEIDVIRYASKMNNQRETTLNHSKGIILLAAGISFIIIILFSVIILNDFWKTQRYRKQLEEANETKSSLLKSREQLISMVSHDLRTPLNTISGFSELLQKTNHNTKESNYITHIRNASAYMGQLVDDLLEFSKLENGHIVVESIPFNLEMHIDEIVQNAKNIVEEKPIRFIVNHDRSIEHLVISDPFRLKQILYNLIINAYKFTNEGSITITSLLNKEADKDQLEISVADTGVGISKDQKENIFKAFTQADSQIENQKKGFGLGLTISKKLAKILGGTLTLESELYKGSTFTLKIPVLRSSSVLITSNSHKPKIVFNLKAIVVEDDDSMQLLLKTILKQHGIEAFVFDNAKKALESIDDIAYDMVFTDIQLPEMNGIHFMETLKNQVSYKDQPIIAMTGRVNMSKEDYMNSGFSEVLIKPFDTDKIVDVLQQFFQSKLSSVQSEFITDNSKKTEGFSVMSLGSFLNHDESAIKKTLGTFIEDTKKNYLLLEEAKNNHDIITINQVGHKMLSMFKQLEVKAVIPYLEYFETAKSIDDKIFIDFEKSLKSFINVMENYLN